MKWSGNICSSGTRKEAEEQGFLNAFGILESQLIDNIK